MERTMYVVFVKWTKQVGNLLNWSTLSRDSTFPSSSSLLFPCHHYPSPLSFTPSTPPPSFTVVLHAQPATTVLLLLFPFSPCAFIFPCTLSPCAYKLHHRRHPPPFHFIAIIFPHHRHQQPSSASQYSTIIQLKDLIFTPFKPPSPLLLILEAPSLQPSTTTSKLHLLFFSPPPQLLASPRATPTSAFSQPSSFKLFLDFIPCRHQPTINPTSKPTPISCSIIFIELRLHFVIDGGKAGKDEEEARAKVGETGEGEGTKVKAGESWVTRENW